MSDAHAHAPLQTVGFSASSLGYAISRRFRETLTPLRLEPREFAVMRAVSATEGRSQQAIGDDLQIPASRMVAFVDGLEARGLLERRPHPTDRRVRALYLTPEGSELLSRAVRAAVELERRLCADLSDRERDQLLDMLARVGSQIGVPAGVHTARSEAFEDLTRGECGDG